MNLDIGVLDHFLLYQFGGLGKGPVLRLKYKKYRSYVVYVVPYTTIVAVFLYLGLYCCGLISIGADGNIDFCFILCLGITRGRHTGDPPMLKGATP